MEVKVLLDSVNPYTNIRLTTLHCVYPQFIHQQVLTHRMFSRNSSSLRAISFDRITDWDLVLPTWTEEKKGMQGSIVTDDLTNDKADSLVKELYIKTQQICKQLQELGIHHQNINDYLRPFTNIHTVITATDWSNFFQQRLHESTKPDMQRLAWLIYYALEDSKPIKLYNHIPLVEDLMPIDFNIREIQLISAARLARISYFKWQDDPQKDLELAKKLIEKNHPSPFEHIAFAQQDDQYYANFKSWKQLRKVLEI